MGSSIAHDRKDAFLFKSCDYRGLARCVCAVFGSDALAGKLSLNRKKTVGKLYDRENNLVRLWRFIRK